MAAPLGAEFSSAASQTPLPNPAQPSGTVNVARMESSSDLLHPGWGRLDADLKFPGRAVSQRRSPPQAGRPAARTAQHSTERRTPPGSAMGLAHLRRSDRVCRA